MHTMNPLRALETCGQAVWFDYIRRKMLGAELDALIRDDGLRGITSNPAIFENAIGHSDDYDAQLDALLRRADLGPMALYEELAIQDIQAAADKLKPVYDRTNKRDGYVSLEVSPYLARDTAATVAEARRLWARVNRPNLMIKVPGTAEGVPAIETLIAEGINVNVTLLFSVDAYLEVANAYISGVERLARTRKDVSAVASVASFFISRIDSAVDAAIDKKASKALGPLKGKVAIANAKMAYAKYQELCASSRWKALAKAGAQPQRLLWASTGTKNPAYPDTYYVDTLIGAETVNTMPPATLAAFRDHGVAKSAITEGVSDAKKVLADLSAGGISLKEITDKLVSDGVRLFADAFDKLLDVVETKRVTLEGERQTKMTAVLPADLQKAVDVEIEAWRAGGGIRRLWAKDTLIWSGGDENKWLGWLDIAGRELERVEDYKKIAEMAKKFEHVLLLGMGGSSLGPEVLGETFGHIQGFPKLHVLDSTDPGQIAATEKAIDLKKTLFIVSSKSGGTLEPNIFKQYFFERARQVLGAEEAPKRFIAVTDPGSNMQKVAERDKFAKIVFGDATIGGRYSVLSPFGLVPGAAMGIDVARFLNAAQLMVRSCGPDVPPRVNPGVQLGTIFGVAGKTGRDKVTVLTGPGLEDFGAWTEQLVAESTGKIGKGLVPVDLEPAADPKVYGKDRVFVHFVLSSRPDPAAARVDALEKAGHPVVRITMAHPYQLGQEFFRWELATAVAGSILAIHPFDQPDVEASKIATKKLMEAYEKTGSLPSETPLLAEGGMKLFTDEKNASALSKAAKGKTVEDYLRAHFGRIGAGDYAGFLAYVPRNVATIAAMQDARLVIRDARKVATVVGFGPRFLHSTGQDYKGGPNSGVFLQITCDDAADIAVPGQKYTFGAVKAAQARGDFDVLSERGRRALRVHLGPNLNVELDKLIKAIRRAVA